MTFAFFIYFAAYELAWFACVLGAANDQPLPGTIIALAVAVFHVARSSEPERAIRLIIIAVLVGTAVDSTLVITEVTRFPVGMLAPWLAPHWMIALWIAFATTFTVSLRPVMTRPWLAVTFGGLGAPLAYYAGASLGAITVHGLSGYIAIGCAWALAMSLLSFEVRRTAIEGQSMQEA